MSDPEFWKQATRSPSLVASVAMAWSQTPHNPNFKDRVENAIFNGSKNDKREGYVVLETRALDEAVFVVTAREADVDSAKLRREVEAWLGIAGIATVDR